MLRGRRRHVSTIYDVCAPFDNSMAVTSQRAARVGARSNLTDSCNAVLAGLQLPRRVMNAAASLMLDLRPATL